MSCCCGYACRCLVDCCIVSWCWPCRWCCGLPSTYEEAYEWQLHPDGAAQMERRYETLVANDHEFAAQRAKAARARDRRREFEREIDDEIERRREMEAEIEQEILARIGTPPREPSVTTSKVARDANRQWEQDGRRKSLMYNQSSDGDDNSDWDHSVDLGKAGGTKARTNGNNRRRKRVVGWVAPAAKAEQRGEAGGTGGGAASPTSWTSASSASFGSNSVLSDRELRDGLPDDPILSERSDYEAQLSF